MNYESAHQEFPEGNIPANIVGHSFWALILPFAEQNALASQYDLSQPGWTGGSTWWNEPNGQALLDSSIPFLTCPSSALPRFAFGGWATADNVEGNFPPSTNIEDAPSGMLPDYVGIQGSIQNLDQTYPGRNGSRASVAGILNNDPDEGGTTFGQISDGSTNTLLLGEQSDFMVKDDGTLTDARSNLGHGFNAGSRERPASLTSSSNRSNRPFNLTTISGPLNEKRLSRFLAEEMQCEKPLVSAHSGTVNVSLGDGSVHSLDDGIQEAVLFNLADRNDGNVTSIE